MSRFGNRPNPTGTGTQFHGGIDTIFGNVTIANATVYAMADGIVETIVDGFPASPNDRDWLNIHYPARSLRTLGNFITIRHSDGYATRYAHLVQGSFLVEENQEVSRGQPIALVGNSGRSMGYHLHFDVFETRLGRRERVDPLRYFNDIS